MQINIHDLIGFTLSEPILFSLYKFELDLSKTDLSSYDFMLTSNSKNLVEKDIIK